LPTRFESTRISDTEYWVDEIPNRMIKNTVIILIFNLFPPA